MIECLRDLDHSLRERGSGLVIREGDPRRELATLASELGAVDVHASQDVGPFARRRDQAVARSLRDVDARLHLHPGLFSVDDPASIRTGSDTPYTVFTPYYRTWCGAPRRDVLRPPGQLPHLPRAVRKGRIPALTALGLTQVLSDPAVGGERHARDRAARFLNVGLGGYEAQRDVLAANGTSALSPYLHFGCVSARELESRASGASAGATAFRRQLCWRDFYAQVLRTFPANAHSEHQQQYRRAIRWSRAERRFDAWCEGRTGYPLVDAAMRQLRAEGWMHNRARLLVGSFLTKDLGIDWRWGERWFMRLLIDGDEASNNGNWQWIASVGVDPQPPARRIFSPTRQQRRFDPHGEYVRRYVPELRPLPDEFLAEPWTMPAEAQRTLGCVIGQDYPEPIVDHARARREAIDRYARGRR